MLEVFPETVAHADCFAANPEFFMATAAALVDATKAASGSDGSTSDLRDSSIGAGKGKTIRFINSSIHRTRFVVSTVAINNKSIHSIEKNSRL